MPENEQNQIMVLAFWSNNHQYYGCSILPKIWLLLFKSRWLKKYKISSRRYLSAHSPLEYCPRKMVQPKILFLAALCFCYLQSSQCLFRKMPDFMQQVLEKTLQNQLEKDFGITTSTSINPSTTTETSTTSQPKISCIEAIKQNQYEKCKPEELAKLIRHILTQGPRFR